MTVKELKRGAFFCKKDISYPAEDQVWIRGEYDRSARRYECTRFSDWEIAAGSCNDGEIRMSVGRGR